MPKYKPGEEKTHFPAIISALVVLALSIGLIIYSLITGGEKPILEGELIEDADGNFNLNPSPNGTTPSSAPNVQPPSYPPPSN